MNHLAWLVGRRFQSLSRREYDWVIVFDQHAAIVVSCLWRLVDSERIRITSEDDGHQFGLPAPVDAAAEVNLRLTDATIEAVEVRQGVLDLTLHFSTGHTIEVIPESSGYEAWNASSETKQFIAAGDGELAIVDDERDSKDKL